MPPQAPHSSAHSAHSLSDDEDTPATPSDPRLDTLHAVHQFLAHSVLKPAPSGALPPARTIAARLLVLQLLIDPGHARPLQYYADHLGMTRSALSLIGVQFSAMLGLRAPWQHSASRAEREAARARAVHRGEYEPTERTQRTRARSTANAQQIEQLKRIEKAERDERTMIQRNRYSLGVALKRQTQT